jgi:phage shock protein A
MTFLRIVDIFKALIHLDRDVGKLIEEVKRMSAELDRLTVEVSETKTVQESAIALLQKLSDLIRNSVNDPAKLTALADDLDAQQKSLADAVAANTPQG